MVRLGFAVSRVPTFSGAIHFLGTWGTRRGRKSNRGSFDSAALRS
jgi:hypothetical protein